MDEPSGGWTGDELDAWVEATFGGPDHIGDHFVQRVGDPGELPRLSADPRGAHGWRNEHLGRFVDAWNSLSEAPMAPPGFVTASPASGRDVWDRLSTSAKAELRLGWEEHLAALAAGQGDGSVVDELTVPSPVLTPVLTPPPEPAPPRRPTAPPGALWWVLGVLVLVALVALAVVALGNGDDPTDDPVAATSGVGATSSSTTVATTTSGAPTSEAPLPIELLAGEDVVTYRGPTELPAGGSIDVTVEVRGPDGAPRAGVPWAITIGDPPSAPDARHGRATTDASGVATFHVTVPEAVGESAIWTSDGSEAWLVAPCTIS